MAQQNKLKPLKQVHYGTPEGFGKKNQGNGFIFSDDIKAWQYSDNSQGRLRRKKDNG